jgi:sugar lactone lactonase YvrE
VLPELLLDARLQLGEGPAWDAQAGILYFVDVHAGDLHIYQPVDGTHRTVNLGESIGCLAPAGERHLVVALRSGIYSFDLENSKRTPLFSPEPHLTGNRFNDGKCDPVGRFLAGSMDDAEEQASGSLYSYSRLGLKTLLTGLRISNGLTWSPDHHTFYFIDTPTRLVMAYDYDLSTGDLDRPRPVVRIPEALGWPDGMTSDTDGKLWVAIWGGAQVTCWDPGTGSMIAAYPLPALNITSCVFGGPQLGDLYITSARKGMSVAQLEQYPHSGGLFRLPTRTTGLPTFSFEG